MKSYNQSVSLNLFWDRWMLKFSIQANRKTRRTKKEIRRAMKGRARMKNQEILRGELRDYYEGR